MGGPHRRTLHYPGSSPVHRAPAHVKLLALVGFMLVVVATPGTAYPVFGVYAALLLVVIVVSRVPFTFLLPRMLVELPFVVFALLLPFIATGPTTTFLGLTVSEHGLQAAASLLMKATIGVVASLTLAATTEPHALPSGLARLRLPHEMVQIMAFMIRYVDVVTDEMRRMRIARESRGFRASSFRQWAVLGRTASALFIRSYERGERVHLAMLSRGHDPHGGRS
ncbi:cobalt ECF transporter T component CbiQ [Mumia zhuanghuii]|uniref:Cobalt ECF transporter T component CbiQ n=1 Tax=Mumia zhuanghuii TaxID=2585211 RepID=A0A5C4MHL4_9ACTN|nr:cobalt ECF transporter T component CbiQ [Mumia zhuanghuii]TNC29401.1 cobalt ECF transporter T component CbiQ [Mumia zhuanghuii]TNC37131.1 cobalt ECF transporter T component CbiQ [Mumia zhuanghuii]